MKKLHENKCSFFAGFASFFEILYLHYFHLRHSVAAVRSSKADGDLTKGFGELHPVNSVKNLQN